jgi:hypothetical protein
MGITIDYLRFTIAPGRTPRCDEDRGQFFTLAEQESHAALCQQTFIYDELHPEAGFVHLLYDNAQLGDKRGS